MSALPNSQDIWQLVEVFTNSLLKDVLRVKAQLDELVKADNRGKRKSLRNSTSRQKEHGHEGSSTNLWILES